MTTKRLRLQTRYLLLALAAIFVLAGLPVRAQDAPPQPMAQNDSQDAPQDNGAYDIPNGADNGQDPPTRVARLSDLEGSVSYQPGGQGDWGAASRNRPVTIGDKLWVDQDARAEIQASYASIHLGSMTAFSFLNMDDQTTQMRLAEGTINFRVRELRQGDVYEVDTPNLAFNVTQAGAFRIEVNENGDATRITAIRGEGQVTAAGHTYTVRAGERGEFNGTDNVTYLIAAAPAPDDFDRWSNDRDLRDDNSVSARYVSREVPGYSDLDENGTWNEEPDYGPVWYPSAVDAGWAPYSYGSWNYVGPWGWTWVGYEPWGFAPYHYGRWAFIGSRWGWCPGPYYARPIYGPAFVGFLGGRGWGVGFGFGFGGGVGWFPLGPREPFHPWYHASGAYYRNVNFNNTRFSSTTIINNRNFNYSYAHNTRAVTVASRNNFVNGQAVNRGAYHVTESSLRGAQVTNRANFTPTRQSYVGAANARGNVARPPAAVQNRTFSSRASAANGVRGPAIGRTAGTAAAANANRPSFSSSGTGNSAASRPTGSNNNRNWAAQGNTTDRGRAPSGFGSNTTTRSDRPPSASISRNGGPGNSGSGYEVSPRSGGSGNGRTYSPPPRGSVYSQNRPAYNPGSNSNRGYTLPRSSPAPHYSQPRSSSPPARSAPSHSSPAPSHSSGGGSHGGGGGSRGGGSSHGH
jgi:hypothetical protein